MVKPLRRIFLAFAMVLSITSCVTLGSSRLLVKRDVFATKYESIKTVVLEEAASNGFSQLTSEVKPSQFNGWTGQLYFALKTPNGTDQLFVEFKPQGDNVSVWAHGAGTRANPDSAAKAIEARLRQF